MLAIGLNPINIDVIFLNDNLHYLKFNLFSSVQVLAILLLVSFYLLFFLFSRLRYHKNTFFSKMYPLIISIFSIFLLKIFISQTQLVIFPGFLILVALTLAEQEKIFNDIKLELTNKYNNLDFSHIHFKDFTPDLQIPNANVGKFSEFCHNYLLENAVLLPPKPGFLSQI